MYYNYIKGALLVRWSNIINERNNDNETDHFLLQLKCTLADNHEHTCK